jgi:hypothetical protein
MRSTSGWSPTGGGDEAELVGGAARALHRREDRLGRVPAELAHAEGGPAVAALLRAAARHLDQHLVAELGVRGDDHRRRQVAGLAHLLGGELELLQLAVGLGELAGVVVRRHEEAGRRGEPAQHRLAVGLLLERALQRVEQVLGGAEREDVDELRHRQRVDGGARAAHQHQRVAGTAVAPPQRHARAVEQLQQVDVVLLERDREGDAAEVADRRARLQRDGRSLAVEEEALAGPVGAPMHQLEGALEAEARHADVVAVGVAEGEPVPRVRREADERLLVGEPSGPVVGGGAAHRTRDCTPLCLPASGSASG